MLLSSDYLDVFVKELLIQLYLTRFGQFLALCCFIWFDLACYLHLPVPARVLLANSLAY